MLYKIGDTVILVRSHRRYAGTLLSIRGNCCRIVYKDRASGSIIHVLIMEKKVEMVVRIGDMVVVPIAGGSFKVGRITSIEDDETCYVAGVEGAVDLLDLIPTYTW